MLFLKDLFEWNDICHSLRKQTMLEKVKIHLGGQSKGDRIHSLPSKFRHPEAVFPIQEHFGAIYFLRLWSPPAYFHCSFFPPFPGWCFWDKPTLKLHRLGGTIIWVPGLILPSLSRGCGNRSLTVCADKRLTSHCPASCLQGPPWFSFELPWKGPPQGGMSTG